MKKIYVRYKETEDKLDKEMKEAARGQTFSKFLAEILNERLKSGQKISIKSEVKDVFLKSGFTEAEAIHFSKLTFLYFCSIGCVSEIPITKEEAQKTQEIYHKFISDLVEHEAPVMLVVSFLFATLGGFADRFFDVALKNESDKTNLEVS